MRTGLFPPVVRLYMYKRGAPSKDCAWVEAWAPRCNVRGEDNVRAREACPATCGAC